MLKKALEEQDFKINFTPDHLEYIKSAREEFLLDIKERSEKIKNILNSVIATNNIPAKKISECKEIAHSIKGTGYTFGFKIISDLAFCIEYILKQQPDAENKKVFKILIEFNILLSDIINYFVSNVNDNNLPDRFTKKMNALLDMEE
jgi:chemotaxis protein histidine kinase CheA